jgi:hypothetical protein
MDYGPKRVREFALNWSIDDGESSPIVLLVHYCARWPSPFYRGLGIDGEIQILATEYAGFPIRGAAKPFDLPTPIYLVIREILEREEL